MVATPKSRTAAAAVVALASLAAAMPLGNYKRAADAWLAAPGMEAKFMANLLSDEPPIFVYNHMPKCAGNTLVDIFTASIPKRYLKIENEFDRVTIRDNSSFVVGSVREPCDYYVSLWSYGVMSSGRLR